MGNTTRREFLTVNSRFGALGWVVIMTLCLILAPQGRAQETCTALMEQDPKLNNLVHAKGYETGEFGSLGNVTKLGTGPKSMILIAGGAFSGDIWENFAASRINDYTMYLVTLAGSAGTSAPPMPAAGTSFGEGTWLRSTETGLLNLIKAEGMQNTIIVAHWIVAPVNALRMALDHPDKVSAVVIVSGVSKMISMDPESYPIPSDIKERAAYIDHILAERWFKTVTSDTWHENNYRPIDYAIHPLRQLQLWRQAAQPPLPVWIRYLCEYYAQDVTLELSNLSVPTLVVQPEFDECYLNAANGGYIEAFLRGSWVGVTDVNPLIQLETVPNSRVFIMDDQLEQLNIVVDRFLSTVEAGG